MEGLRQRGIDVVWASVHYRLAPDYPWPAAPDDCFRALEYLLADSKLGAASRSSKSGNDIYDSDQWRAGLNLTGGVHVAGLSAGGTLAIVTALRAIKANHPVRTMFVDEPMLRLEDISEGQGGTSTMGGELTPSWHRNSYTRTAPVLWLDWCWRAYLRDHCNHDLVEESESNHVDGNSEKEKVVTASGQMLTTSDPNQSLGASPHVSCTQDTVEGGMDASSWISAFKLPDNNHSIAPPILKAAVVVTARGCPMYDAGVAYANTLKQAEVAVWPPIGEAESTDQQHTRQSVITHVDARGSHAFPFLMDPSALSEALDSWSRGFL